MSGAALMPAPSIATARHVKWDDVVDELERLPCEPELVWTLELSRIAESGSPLVDEVIRALRRETGARTLEDLLDEDVVDDVLRHALRKHDRTSFFRDLLDVVEDLAAEDSDEDIDEGLGEDAAAPPPAVAVPAGVTFDLEDPPPGGAALDAWAAHFGVADLLDQWLRSPGGGRRGPQPLSAPLRAWIDLERFPETGKALGHDRMTLRRLGVAELVGRARALAPLRAARTAFLARRLEPADPWVAERVDRMRKRLRREHEVDRAPLAERYPHADVLFQKKPATLQVRSHDSRGPRNVLVDVESGLIRLPWNDMLEPPRTREQGRAIACAIDALCDPASEALAQVLAWHATPAWLHALEAFEGNLAKNAAQALDSAVDADERIAFRVDEHADHGRGAGVLSLLVQKPKRGGGHTAGKQIEPYHALRVPSLTPVEHEIVEIAMLLDRSTYSTQECAHVRVRALELLADHPRVVAGPDKAPVRVRRVRPVLRVVSAEAGFVFELLMGDAPLAPADVLERHEGGLLCLHDRPAHAFLFAPLDRTTLALLSAVAEHAAPLPNEGLDALLARLAATPGVAVDLELPEQARGEALASDPRPVVRLTLTDGTLFVAIRARPIERGPVFLPGSPPAHAYASRADGKRVFATRDLDGEESRAEQILARLPLAGAARRGPFDLAVDDLDRACDLVATLRELGDEVIVEWERDEQLRVVGSASTRALRLNIDRKKDWFGLSGSVEVDGEKVSLLTLLDAVRAGRRFVRLEGGRLVAIERELRRRLSRLDDVAQRVRGGGVAIHAPAVATVSELVDDESEQIVAAREWSDLRDRIRRAKASEPEAPRGVRAELRSYQLDGYKWLMRLAACGVGACLADDMGLGKTLQSLAVLQARKDEGPALVVAPTSVCANWIAEAARFTPELDVVEYRGAGRTDRLEWIGPGHVLVTSYDILVRDVEKLRALELATAIFDEAQAIKNGLSKRAAASREVKASFRMALTGTPVENHTGDLWSIFRTIVPGLFGSWEDFRARFSLPIDRDKDPARREALAAMVRPYLLRRTKREVSPELPPRTEVVRLVEPTPEEQALYEAERAQIVASLANRPETANVPRAPGEEGRFAILAALTRLRQLACHPRLRDPDAPGTSAKLEAVLAMIDELREAGHKALVFSQFTGHLAIVAEALRERGVTFFELDGSTPAEARADRVRRFQAGEADMFLISLKAGGVGLNLTAADYVLHLDPWWNPASEDQASDRAHRIGQDKPVTIVRFVTQGTIEESVLSLHDDKRELAEAILSGGDVAGRLSTRELFALIETGAQAI